MDTTHPTGSIGLGHVDDVLADAIQDATLPRAIAELRLLGDRLTGAARRRLDEARHSVDEVIRRRDDELERLAAILERAGIAARTAASTPERPLEAISVRLSRGDVDPAVAVLERNGYSRFAPVDEAGWRAYRTTRGFCRLHRSDGAPFRVEMSWPTTSRRGVGRVRRLVAPDRSDFDALTLPAPLWLGYPLVHVLRLPWRWATGHQAADLGPFMTTPEALIEPLVRWAAVGPDDLLVDLGCGDGRIAIRAAELTGCRARGIESDGRIADVARTAAATSPAVDRIEIVHADASTIRLDDADVVVAFLPTSTVSTMVGDLLSRLRIGARFIAHEQQRLHAHPAASSSIPLFSREGITVAHRWEATARERT